VDAVAHLVPRRAHRRERCVEHDSLAFLVGPAIGGLVVATTSVEAMFVVTAGMFLASAVLIARIHQDPLPPVPTEAAVQVDEASGGGLLRATLAGGFTTDASMSAAYDIVTARLG
jgi:hypothetical protein